MSSDPEQLKRDARHVILDLQQMKAFCENPLIICEGEGIHVTDIDGKRYLDAVSGIYVASVGHGEPRVIEAIRRQHDRIAFVAPLHGVSDTAIRYAKRLAGITPEGLNTVKLLSGGSESTESALKFARQYHRQTGNPHKYKVIGNYSAYHGGTLGAMSMTGLGGPRKNVFGPFLEGFIHLPPPRTFRLSDGAGDGAAWSDMRTAELLEHVIAQEGPESVAAYIIEPISNTGGIFVPSTAYFERVREICTANNVLLIYDEIITGMGRTGNWFAAQTFGVAPDILCIGKGLSGGYAPLAAMVVRDELHLEAFWGEPEQNIHFAHGHTFGGNPVSAAVGLAMIDVIEQDDLIARGRRTGEHLRARLERQVAELGILGQVRGCGALSCVEFVQDMATKQPFADDCRFGKRIERRLLDAGVITRCDPHWIAFAPPLTATVAQADQILDIFMRCVQEELAAMSLAIGVGWPRPVR